MPDPQRTADLANVQVSRFRAFSLIAAVAALIAAGLNAVDGLWRSAAVSALIALVLVIVFLWVRSRPQRTTAGMTISLYSAMLGMAAMSYLELPDAATVPFFMALIVLAAAYSEGVRSALVITTVGAAAILVVYLAYAWGAATGYLPDTGYALVGTADVAELVLMALRRIIFLFAVFGIATAARRALDRQLSIVHQRERTIHLQSGELRKSQRHYSTLAESVPVGILETDNDGCAVFVNRAWRDLVARPAQELLGNGWHACIHPDDLEAVLGLMNSSLEAHKPSALEDTSEHTFRLRTADGELRWMTSRVSPLVAGDGTTTGHLMAAIDTTLQRTASERLSYLATHDPLTGSLNRAAFGIEVDSAVARAKRYKTRCAVLFVDVDDFKEINDRFGHLAGDVALDTVVRRIQGNLRGVDTVGRLGGDEFGILLDQVRAGKDVALAIRRLQGLFATPIVIDSDTSIDLRFSVGSAVFPEDGQTHDELMSAADADMYQMKRAGNQRGS